MKKSRIPVPVRKGNTRADKPMKRQEASSSSTSLPGTSTAAKPTEERLIPESAPSNFPKQPICTDEQLLRPSSSPYSSPGSNSAEQPASKREKQLLPISSCTSLPRSTYAQQPIHERSLRPTSNPRLLLESSSAERLADKPKLPDSFSASLPLSGSAKQTIGTPPLPGSSSLELPEPSCIAQPIDHQLTPSSSSPSLLGPAQFRSAEQPANNWLRTEQTHRPSTDGRQTGHQFANSLAKDNSRVHYGDNYNATYNYNYQAPNPENEIPRNLDDAIVMDKVNIYLDLVMGKLSCERMGLRKSTVAPALVNTCQWLLACPEYISWRDPDQIHDHHGFMWIKSKAGAGKSTTMKFLSESTRSQHPSDTVISFFFNARGDEMEKTLDGLYRHLLHQLLCSVSRLQYFMADEINEIASQGWQLQPLKDLLRRAVLDLQSDRVTCFIDALDESSEDEIRGLIDFFEELGNDVVAKHIGFRVCFSGRHYPNVELEKCQYLNLDNKRGHEKDIALYIKSKLRPQRDGIPDNLPELVQKKAQGVFLWVVLVTQILKKDYDRGDIHKAHSRLEGIPPGLHNLFFEIIHRNAEDPDDNKNLLCVLQWIAFARRPLSPQDLYFAVRSKDPDFQIPNPWTSHGVSLKRMRLFILNCSKGLAELTTSRSRPTVQFIHESVRNFLNETGFDILTPGRDIPLLGFAHNNLAQCCLPWASNTQFQQLHKATSQWLDSEDTPLVRYCIEHMIKHAEEACRNGVSQEDFVRSCPIDVWVPQARRVDDEHMFRVQPTPEASLVEIFAYHHAETLLKIALRQTGSRLSSSQFETALRIALSQNEMESFRFLLEHGSPSQSSVGQQARTLLFAVNSRNKEALQLMLRCGKYGVPLQDHAAVMSETASHADVVSAALESIRMLMKASAKRQ